MAAAVRWCAGQPDDLDPAFAQAGVELTVPYPFLDRLFYPLAAVDVQAAEETDWDIDLSLGGGVEVRSDLLAGRRLQVLGSDYQGRSPNGQFYRRRIEYVGLGLYCYF